MTGRFVWHELMTTDTKGAIAFYTEVIGWKTQPFNDSPDPYTMWVGSQGPLGGVMTLPDAAKKMGAPPHWMGHIAVDDVDATVVRAKDAGATIYVPPQDVPTVGRFSVIADPQGASISLFKPANAMAAHDTSKPGEITWNELYASDGRKAFDFYAKLLGWTQQQEMDLGPQGKYIIFGEGETSYGGMMTKTADMPMPPMWVYYIHVDDLDAAMARASSKGAKKLMGPMDIPGGDVIAQFIDPQGAFFALHGPGKKKN